MKFDRYVWIGVGIFLVYLSVPIFLGHIPSFPRKSGVGWTPEISMVQEPEKFWSYERGMMWQVGILLLFSYFARRSFTHAKKKPNQLLQPTRTSGPRG